MNYFYDCSTAEEAKIKYRELVKKHHPDSGGDAMIFIEIQRQYKGFTADDLGTKQDTDEIYNKYYQSRYGNTQQRYGHMHNGPIDNTRGRYTRPDMQFHADVVQLKLQISLLEGVNNTLRNELKDARHCLAIQSTETMSYQAASNKYMKESKHHKELWNAEYTARCNRDTQIQHMQDQIIYLQKKIQKPWYIRLKELVYDKK